MEKTLSDEIKELAETYQTFSDRHSGVQLGITKSSFLFQKHLQEFKEELKDIEIWNCSPDEYLDKVNQLYVKHFGDKLI